MLTKPVALALLAAGCIAAAGGGAYLALRQNTANGHVPVAAAQAPLVTEEAVRETEELVAPEETAAPAPAPVPAEPAPRETAPARAERPARAPVASAEPAPRPSPAAAPMDAGWSNHDGPAASIPVPVEAEESEWPAPAAWDSPARDEPLPVYEDLVVTAGSVIGLQIETPATSEQARVEDRIEARVTRDVLVDGRVAVPAGTRAMGSITEVERGGKIKERARLGVRFHTLVLADGSRLSIDTEALLRECDSPSKESTAKIGGAAAGGAVLGAILGGTRGAVIGGAAGAAGGTAAAMAGERNAATLPAGATVTVRLSAPVTVTIER